MRVAYSLRTQYLLSSQVKSTIVEAVRCQIRRLGEVMPEHYAGTGTILSFKAICSIAFAAITVVGLGGCASSFTPGLPSAASAGLAPRAETVRSAAKPVRAVAAAQTIKVAAPSRKVAIRMPSIIGMPKNISGKLKKKLSGKLNQRNVKLVQGRASYFMRGYLAASPENNGVKIAYIWDVSNKAGKRQHRIIGEEFVSRKKGGDAWSGVNDTVLSNIARRTANDLSGWLAKKEGGGVRVSTKAPASRRVAANRIPRRAQAPVRGLAVNSGSQQRTVMAMVMPVSGAPGDGRSSLTKAIKGKLYNKGVRLTSSRSGSVYQVRGVVQVGKSKGDIQPIRIDWRVYDPKGKRIGTVTQRNNIPSGSLNGSWGPIATAAAGAAADGIVKLLPRKSLNM